MFSFNATTHTHTNTLFTTYTHTQRGGPGFLCDQQTRELNLWPLPGAWGPGGCSITELIHSSLPGLARAPPAHPLPQLARNTQHSVYSPAPHSTAHATVWCSIKTPLSKFHSEDLIWSWKLHGNILRGCVVGLERYALYISWFNTITILGYQINMYCNF